MFRRL